MPISAANLKTLRVNPDWARLPLFDRTGWKNVRFGEVVEILNETVRDPGPAGIARFIGLAHLEPGSLLVRQMGQPGGRHDVHSPLPAGAGAVWQVVVFDRKCACCTSG